MGTMTFTSARDFKEFENKNRKTITNINGVDFNHIYPMIETSRKHTSYYDVNTSENVYLSYPLTVTVK